MVFGDESHRGAVHMQITTIGLDIAKNVFQIHGIDAAENAVGRALNGVAPADIPIQQATKLILAINLKIAKAIGSDVPEH